MKKVLIVSHAMELGGAERALLGILEKIDTDIYDVDLFLLRHEGELLNLIPEGINLLPVIPEYTVLARPMIEVLREGHILLTAARLYGKFKTYLFNRKDMANNNEDYVALEYSHKYTKKFMPEIQPDVEYDLAISFLTPHYFVTEKVSAKCKLAWIHTDYSNAKIDVNSELKMWDAYTHIVSISEDVTNSFLSVFPSLKSKIILIENILPEILIRKQAEMPVSEKFDFNKINLLSIGRFSYPKNFDNIPDICKQIVERNKNIQWYIMGYGNEEALIRQKIIEAGMQDNVIILGKKENPYPYIKMCDIYVQPSRYEGKCIAVREAQMLGKPVVITDYETSSSQLEDGTDGIVVPMDNNNCAAGLIKVIKNKELQEKLKECVSKRDYTNSVEIKKIYEIIDRI